VKESVILNEFCCWKFKQIAKIEFASKIQLSPQCVHTWANGTGYTSVNENKIAILLKSSG
jgi:hypothetical protein